MGLVWSVYGRAHAFVAGLAWLPRVLRLSAATAGLLAVAQANQPWMHVTFTHPSSAGEGYDWGWSTFSDSLIVVALGAGVLVGVIRGDWRRRGVQGGTLFVGLAILYYSVSEFLRIKDLVDRFNADEVDLSPVPGWFVGPGLYLAMAAGAIAVAVGVIGILATERPTPDYTRQLIYHLVEEADFRNACGGRVYRPVSIRRDGFVHCSLDASVIHVANDYFTRHQSPVLLLQIDPESLHAETKYEAAAPLPDAPKSHVRSAPVFPHVYGPINLDAIEGVGVLSRGSEGFSWPKEFFPLDVVLG